MRSDLTPSDLARALVPGSAHALHPPPGDTPLVVVHGDDPTGLTRADVTLHSGVAAIVVGVVDDPDPDPAAHPLAPWCDVIVQDEGPELATIELAVGARPIASLALAVLLRGSEGRSVDDGLLLESATYSALQAGPEFAAWRSGHPLSSRPPDVEPPLVVERSGDALRLELNRPHVRNALDVALRDQLLDALTLAVHDDTIRVIELSGRGRGYSSGGDLAEFGSFPDPASAHLVRLQASIGRVIHSVRDRVAVRLHGTCAGSGIEIPAFAGRVVAEPDVTILLPELELGLVPGAGGTVSLPRRIGRHRTALLAMTGRRLDAATAHAWGLVDEVTASG